MALPKLKLASAAPSRSSERVALASAIARDAEWRENLRAANAALAKATEVKWSAQARLEALRKQEPEDVGDLIASINSGALTIAKDATKAEEAKLEAEVDHWTKAQAACQARVAQCEDALRSSLVEGRALEVILAEADRPGLLARYERAHREFAELGQVLGFVSRQPVWTHRDYGELEGVRQWRAAFDALLKDADAPLPHAARDIA